MRMLLVTLLLAMGASALAVEQPTPPPLPTEEKNANSAAPTPTAAPTAAPATAQTTTVVPAPVAPQTTTTAAPESPVTAAPKNLNEATNAKEKILNSISKMTPKEIAELMNFITAMEEAVSNTPVSEDALQSVPTSVRDTLKRIVKSDPDKVVVTNTPIHGLYEAVVESSEVIYVSGDGRYVVMGDLRDAQTGRNLTEDKRDGLRKDALNTVKESDMIVFAPTTAVKETLNVFTDVDCGYCAKFHQEAVKKLNEAGIKVRYLAFPRAGKGSPTYQKMVSVWCAEDKQKAITAAKAGEEVKAATCDNYIDKEYELGKKIGVTGTPALVLSTGELIPGFVPPERLIPYILGQSTSLLRGRP